VELDEEGRFEGERAGVSFLEEGVQGGGPVTWVCEYGVGVGKESVY
jgi:hypothetical protein